MTKQPARRQKAFDHQNKILRRMLLFASLLLLFATAVPILGYILEKEPLTDVVTCALLGLPPAFFAFGVCMLMAWEFRAMLAEHHRKTTSKPADNDS